MPSGSIVGVAAIDALSGADVVPARRGIFTLVKVAGVAWTIGLSLYWDNTARSVITVSASNKMIGTAFAAALSGDTTGQVILDGAFR